MVILLLFVPHPFGAPSRPEGVGKLRDRENAFAVEFLTLLFAHAGQQAKVVLFTRLQSAPGLELTTHTPRSAGSGSARVARG